MSVHLPIVALEAAVIMLAIVMMVAYLRAGPRNRNAWLVAFLALGLIAYVVSARWDYRELIPPEYTIDFGAFFPVLNLIRNAAAGAFALLCFGIFREGRALPKWLLAGIALQLTLEEPVHWLLGAVWETAHPLGARLLLDVLPTALQVTFLGFALYWMLVDRAADLVEARRRTRRVLLVWYVVQAASALIVERNLSKYGAIPVPAIYPIHVMQVFFAFSTLLVIVWDLLRRDVILNIDPLRQAPATPTLDVNTLDVDTARIRAAFATEHVHRQAGLTVRDLATHLSLPEYRLRRLIHDRLGYRNFNALLHHYRITEVCEALADPRKNGQPVLTVALSAGYQSLTPFNRAFRELKGMTPTEYRSSVQRHLVENGNSMPISRTD